MRSSVGAILSGMSPYFRISRGSASSSLTVLLASGGMLALSLRQ